MTAPPASLPAAPLVMRTFTTASGAVVAEIAPHVTAPEVFRHLAAAPHLLFLDSAAVDEPPSADAYAPGAPPRLGRFSFVAADPIHSLVLPPAAGAADIAAAFSTLRTLLADLACATIPALPPFQGGVAGLVAYEWGLARLGITPQSPSLVPLLSLHIYDVVAAFDHDAGRGWIISQGVPAKGPVARRARATARLDAFLARLAAAPPVLADHAPPAPLPPDAGHPLASHPHVFSTHAAAAYRDMVRRGIEYVRAGDVFQVNLAQRFAAALAIAPVELYLQARALNAAPFAGFFDAGLCQIASMSPERLLQVTRGTVRMHPIKGTRRVIANPEADLYAGADLGASAKDRAENVMIVDLVRNDLARVCTPESVQVEALCRLERYRYVQHLVSIVAGRLRRGFTALDALDAALPGGSVTGAPKHRACEIIAELEGFARGAYCGSLGYLGFDGSADFNLLIRTFISRDGRLTFAAGGGITAASDPAAEYAESLHKTEGMLRVLDSFGAAPEAAP